MVRTSWADFLEIDFTVLGFTVFWEMGVEDMVVCTGGAGTGGTIGRCIAIGLPGWCLTHRWTPLNSLITHGLPSLPVITVPGGRDVALIEGLGLFMFIPRNVLELIVSVSEVDEGCELVRSSG